MAGGQRSRAIDGQMQSIHVYVPCFWTFCNPRATIGDGVAVQVLFDLYEDTMRREQFALMSVCVLPPHCLSIFTKSFSTRACSPDSQLCENVITGECSARSPVTSPAAFYEHLDLLFEPFTLIQLVKSQVPPRPTQSLRPCFLT